MFSTRLVRSVALAALLAPSIGFAQSAAPTPPTAAPASSSPAPSAATQTAVDQRSRALQSQLGITEAQMPLWTAFAQAMRDNAAATDALFTQRAGAVATMNALDNMHSYAPIARAYADSPERLPAASDSLVAALSDPQKQAPDTLCRQQPTAAAQPKARR